MSKGNRRLTLRLTEEEYAALKEELAARNSSPRTAPWTVSDFVRFAVLEEVGHRHRNRKQPRPLAKPETGEDRHYTQTQAGKGKVPGSLEEVGD